MYTYIVFENIDMLVMAPHTRAVGLVNIEWDFELESARPWTLVQTSIKILHDYGLGAAHLGPMGQVN